MLAAVAAETNRIRLGCQVTGMIYRHPAVLANIAATVDHISGGRLDIGLGAGWNQQECDAYGIPLPPLQERFDRFDEGVEAVVSAPLGATDALAGLLLERYDEARTTDVRMNCDACLYRIALPGRESAVGAPQEPHDHPDDLPG